MAGAGTRAGANIRRTVLAAVVLGAVAVAPGVAAGAGADHGKAGGRLELPVPVQGVDPLARVNLGLRPDRLLRTSVPGALHDDEAVTAELGPSGAPARVVDDQRLVVTGTGGYVIRELGPARAAVAHGSTVPPVLELGTVVWQGFSPGRRTLAARLTLDTGIEAARLPMAVRLVFRDAAGRVRPLGPGARAPADGVVAVVLRNATASARVVAAGTARLRPLARVLDRLRSAAQRPRAGAPPVAGSGLPRTLPGRAAGHLSATVVAPLRVTGTLTTPGGAGAVTGPGLTPTATGARVTGTLTGTVTFAVHVHAGDRLGLRLDVRPWPDPRTLDPPAPFGSWQAWASAGPATAAVTAATQTFVAAVAAAARAAEYTPYLQADAPGTDRSTFRYVVAAPAATHAPTAALRARPGAIAAATLALLAIVVNAALLRRRL